MSRAMTEENDTQAASLSAAEIIAWLRANPGFFHDYPEACDHLEPPRAHKESGRGVVDFQQIMVRRLRADRDGIIEEAREIVETSRANMSNQARIHRAVIMLLDARDFEDFIHIVTMDLAALLDVDIIALIIEADGEAIPHIGLAGVQVVGPGTIGLLTKGQPVVLESHIRGLAEIYGGGAGLVKSQALLSLHIADGAPAAMLAFGSRNPELFAAGQGTELIGFLGHVIERCFGKWLDLPPRR